MNWRHTTQISAVDPPSIHHRQTNFNWMYTYICTCILTSRPVHPERENRLLFSEAVGYQVALQLQWQPKGKCTHRWGQAMISLGSQPIGMGCQANLKLQSNNVPRVRCEPWGSCMHAYMFFSLNAYRLLGNKFFHFKSLAEGPTWLHDNKIWGWRKGIDLNWRVGSHLWKEMHGWK